MGYEADREMEKLENQIKDNYATDKPRMTKSKFIELTKKMKKDKAEYEKKHGISLSENRKKMLKKGTWGSDW